MNPSHSSQESSANPSQSPANRTPASFADVLAQIERLAWRLEKALADTKELPAKISAKLDAKPMADSLGNTLRLELNRTLFRETATGVEETVRKSLKELEIVKLAVVDASDAARLAVEKVEKATKNLPNYAWQVTEAADKLKAMSFRWIFGSAVIVGLAVAGVLTWEGRGYYREKYEAHLAATMQIEGPNREAVIELTRRGHRLTVGPVVNNFNLEVGRFLRVSGAENAVAKDGQAIIYLQGQPNQERR